MTISRIMFPLSFVIIFTVISAAGSYAETGQTAKSSTPAPAPASADCLTLIYNMSDCLTYVEKGSTVSKPDKPCCPELAGMLDSKPLCLCQLLGKSKDFPVELDVKRALKLPDVCGLKTAPLIMCSVVGMPVEGPAGAPTSSEGLQSAGGKSPDDAGDVSPGKNGASNAFMSPLYYIIAALAIVLASLAP